MPSRAGGSGAARPRDARSSDEFGARSELMSQSAALAARGCPSSVRDASASRGDLPVSARRPRSVPSVDGDDRHQYVGQFLMREDQSCPFPDIVGYLVVRDERDGLSEGQRKVQAILGSRDMDNVSTARGTL